ARATRTAAIAAGNIEDARRARSSHGRRQALHCDCGAEDASRRIGAGLIAPTCRSLGCLSLTLNAAWMRLGYPVARIHLHARAKRPGCGRGGSAGARGGLGYGGGFGLVAI